jgi:hypothetical protein
MMKSEFLCGTNKRETGTEIELATKQWMKVIFAVYVQINMVDYITYQVRDILQRH